MMYMFHALFHISYIKLSQLSGMENYSNITVVKTWKTVIKFIA